MSDKPNFFKNHIDTIAIVSVNVAMAAIIIGLWTSNSSRIDSANTRIDTVYTMFYDLLKETKKKDSNG